MPPQDFEEWPQFVQPGDPDNYKEQMVTAYNEWRKEMAKHQQIWLKAENELKALVNHSVFQQQQKLNEIKEQAWDDFDHCKNQRRQLLQALSEEDGADHVVWSKPSSHIILSQVGVGGGEEGEEVDDEAAAVAAAAVLTAGESRETSILVDWVDMDMKTEESSDTSEADAGKSTKSEKRPRLHYGY